MKKIISLLSVFTMMIASLLIFPVTANAEEVWDPATFDVVSDASSPGTVFAINPAMTWAWQDVTPSTGYWGGVLGTLKCFICLNQNIDNKFFVYETKPLAANALTVYYQYGNFVDWSTLHEGRNIRVYTSEDLTEWTEVTGDNLKQTFAGFPEGTDNSFQKVFVGVNEMPATHRYIKFSFPRITPEMTNATGSSFMVVGSFLQKGGTDYQDHSNDAYFFHDDLSTLDKVFCVGGIDDPGWALWPQEKPEKDTAVNSWIGDWAAYANAFAKGNFVAYRVAPNSRVVFRCKQSLYINEWVDSGEWGQIWTYNSGTYDQNWGFTVEISKDSITWEDCDYTRESYPLWLGGNFDENNQPTEWYNWFCQGQDVVYIGVPSLPDGYQFVRVNFPKEPINFTYVKGNVESGNTQYWDAGLSEVIAYSDKKNTPVPSTIPGVRKDFQKYISITSSAEDGNILATTKNMTVGQLLGFLTTEGGYTLNVMSRYDDEVDDGADLETGMKLNVCLGNNVLNSFVIDAEEAEGDISDVIAQLTEAAKPTESAKPVDDKPSPGTGDMSSNYMYVILLFILAVVVLAIRKYGNSKA